MPRMRKNPDGEKRLSPHPELSSEQAYVDHAYACAQEELGRRTDGDFASSAADRYSARKLRVSGTDRIAALKGGLQRNLCLGSMVQGDDGNKPTYIGRCAVWDGDHELVLVSGLAESAESFFRASPKNPHGLLRRRRFICDGQMINDIVDEALAEPLPRGMDVCAPEFDDVLLAELQSERGSELRDIIATIRAEQYEIAAEPLERDVLVQGGPGTGKTAVALHRAAYLMFNHREELSHTGVLVVGPNATFMEYVRSVLPALGETQVDQSSVDLLTPLRPKRTDEPAVQRLKGDLRMAGLINGALKDRIAIPDEDLEFRHQAAEYSIPSDAIRGAIADLIGKGPYMTGRTRFRNRLLELGAEAVLAGGALSASDTSVGEVRGKLRRNRDLRNGAERIWPTMTPQRLVHELLVGTKRMKRAAGEDLAESEQRQLRRPETSLKKAHWTYSDVPLFHEAEHLINGTSDRYGLVIVDEAQDLTPMQVLMIGRRAGGSLSVFGDLAQATGPHAWGSWREFFAVLPSRRDVVEYELTLGYRVPREIVEFAQPVLDAHPAGVAAIQAIRESGVEPVVEALQSDDLLVERTVGLAMERLAAGGTVGVIAPVRLHASLVRSAAALGTDLAEADRDGLGDEISLLSPTIAKGLEFDHVIVVEPLEIARTELSGLSLLYVTLTRATRTLAVLHQSPLPSVLGGPVPIVEPPPSGDDGRSPTGLTESLALAAALIHRSSEPASILAEALRAAADALERGDEPGRALRARVAQILGPPYDDLLELGND